MNTNSEKVWRYIYNYQQLRGYSPSLDEIRQSIHLKSLRGTSLQLDKLEKLGYIQRKKGYRRAIEVLIKPEIEKSQDMVTIPLVGEIKAGTPALAQENIEEYKKIPNYLLHGRSKVYLLKVKGDSMTKAGYNSGDIVIVAQQQTADNGDIVVAFIPDEESATLKRFKKMQDYILLLPESYNPIYKPIIERDVVIQGKVIEKLPENLY
ncbi:MAG: repressor LexA [Candidatus Levybacteria bacterium]|nr:repressor LexA [Candidatus Levybacteria bacterium]